MHTQRNFKSSHIIRAVGSIQNHFFPTTLRDVYAFRIRFITQPAFVGTVPTVLTLDCPQLVCGYRTSSLNGNLRHSVAQFPISTMSGFEPRKNIKHYFSSDIEINKLQLYWMDESGGEITIAQIEPTYLCIDFWHRNKHEY